MLPGFNSNLQHRGQFFHVQTEDSGRRRPHVVTQLFLNGNVLASFRSEYAEHLDDPDLDARIRRSMQRQHREMLKRLKRGEWDGLLDPGCDSVERVGLPAAASESGREGQSQEVDSVAIAEDG